MNATLRTFSSDVRKELSIQDDRTESDNRIEVTLLKGIAENNLPHTVRCKSTKPPYAERHVRWCGRSVNVKVGGKCLLWITFTSYPIILYVKRRLLLNAWIGNSVKAYALAWCGYAQIRWFYKWKNCKIICNSILSLSVIFKYLILTL